jgi:dihydroorotate dehydrogenase electron transfer subunit
MLRAVRAVARRHEVPCYLSLEAAMACGLGACLGCAVEAAGGGYVHVCSDGPVFDAEEVWP